VLKLPVNVLILLLHINLTYVLISSSQPILLLSFVVNTTFGMLMRKLQFIVNMSC